MNTLKAPSSLALALALAASIGVTSIGSANAADATREASGRIQQLNPRAHHLTVKSHQYSYDPSHVGLKLQRGENVRILYREHAGHRYAVQIFHQA